MMKYVYNQNFVRHMAWFRTQQQSRLHKRLLFSMFASFLLNLLGKGLYNFSEIPSLFQNHTLGYITYPFGLIHFHKFRNGHRQTKGLGETVGTDCLDTKELVVIVL